jgi:hypothetical protein
MVKQTWLTRALLACGIVGGPVYVMVAMIQALTRDGFDLSQHRFSWLTGGDLGWIQQSNMALAGALTLLFAAGVRRVMQPGKGAAWGPRLLALFATAYIVGGLLSADPAAGFPPGTPDGVRTSWQGAAQNASRSASTVSLLAANLVLAMRFAAEGRRRRAWFYAAGFPLLLGTLTAVGSIAFGLHPAFAVAILATPWILVTTLALHLYRREASQGDVLAEPGMRRHVVVHAPHS